MSRSILVLDDDTNFRQLLSRLLSATGYEVVQAGSAADGLALLANTELVLAVVDFKLPDTNGITFISKLRESGSNTPVVFISAQACDPETFRYLRNILRVSLVLQKPIQPTLFFEQIAGLLPGQSHERAAQGDALLSAERQRSQAAVANLPSLRAERQRLASEHPETQAEQYAQEISQKQQLDDSVRDAQRDLAASLPAQWEKLALALRTVQEDGLQRASREESMLLAHNIRTAAASLGLVKLGESAAKIEGYVKLLDPNDPLAQNILWLETFRALADGHAELDNILGEPAAAPRREMRVQAGRILLLGNQNTIQVTSEKVVPSVDAKVLYTDSAVDAAVQAASSRFDAAILDMAAVGKDVVVSLARELRMSGLNERLPLAFLHPSNLRLDDVDRIFGGCSLSLPSPCDQRQFETCLAKLASISPTKPPTVLCVDDDKVLTRLIERVLGSNGINVAGLNEPITVLDTLEKVQPDLLLLDVIMPGLSGYDICRIVRATERWSQLPIIFLTSKSDAQGRAAAFQAGANDFLAKPVIPEELLGRVQMQLQRAKQEKQENSSDQLTGLLRETAFMSRADELLINCGRLSHEMVLCLVRVDQLDIREYGMFANINVLSTVGKLLQSRFSAETLRGIWTGGFCLVFQNEFSEAVAQAVARWVREVEQVRFTAEDGRSFSIKLHTAMGKYPADGFSLQALIHAARERLENTK